VGKRTASSWYRLRYSSGWDPVVVCLAFRGLEIPCSLIRICATAFFIALFQCVFSSSSRLCHHVSEFVAWLMTVSVASSPYIDGTTT
jgi:hypothetical protein